MSEIRDPSREQFTEASSDTSFGGGSDENAGRRAQVLLIEDDCAIRGMIENYLTQHGMSVVSAADRNSAVRHLSDEQSLIILDLQLGKDDGLDLLRAIRSRSDVPIIITTGHRRDEVDRVVGLELGADDYLTKPFGLRELLARIRAVLRRRQAGLAASRRDAAQGRSQFGGGWLLDRRPAPSHRSKRRYGASDKSGIRPVGGLSRCASTSAQPRTPDAGHAHARRRVRSQH